MRLERPGSSSRQGFSPFPVGRHACYTHVCRQPVTRIPLTDFLAGHQFGHPCRELTRAESARRTCNFRGKCGAIKRAEAAAPGHRQRGVAETAE